MEPYQFVLTILGAVIITAFIIYKIKEKSPRFRLIEENITDNIYEIPRYIPQVRLEGKWFYINTYGTAETYLGQAFLDPNDAINLIHKFQSREYYLIHSNKKLNSNQKQIIVE